MPLRVDVRRVRARRVIGARGGRNGDHRHPEQTEEDWTAYLAHRPSRGIANEAAWAVAPLDPLCDEAPSMAQGSLPPARHTMPTDLLRQTVGGPCWRDGRWPRADGRSKVKL